MNSAVFPDPVTTLADTNPAQVRDADRLSFTLFVALVLHAAIILGIGFDLWRNDRPPHTLEVTLSLHQSDKAPERADFLAQTNQIGSGTEARKSELTTTEQADFHSDVINPVQLQTPTTTRQQTDNQQRKFITTQGNSQQQVARITPAKESRQKLLESDVESLKQRTVEIASLEAQLSHLKQAYAKRPRIRQVTSVSAKAHRDARYIDNFRKKIEDIGTRNFPAEALQRSIFGEVRLLVAIGADGRVRNIEILKSSGHNFLDQAAIASVKLAEPFDPFPEAIRKDTDILEIIRTWKFDRKQVLSSHF